MGARGERRETSPAPRRSPLRQLARNLGLCVGSLILVLLTVELVLRIALPLQNIFQREYDAELGWRGRPNIRCVLKSDGPPPDSRASIDALREGRPPNRAGRGALEKRYWM